MSTSRRARATQNTTKDLLPPKLPDTLFQWIRRYIRVEISLDPLVPGHSAPFDYLVHTFFEGRFDPIRSSTLLSQVAAPAHFGAADPANHVTTVKTTTYDKSEARFSQKLSQLSPKLSKTLQNTRKLSIFPHISSSPHPSPPDSLVWANRGGGKTFLAALATLLDLLFKPHIHVTILGGSLEQSQRMHEHLRKFFELPSLSEYLAAPITDRRVLLTNKSRATVLAQSQASVRGTRVQKLRCDELDLFDPDIWAAVQLTTRSLRSPPDAPWGPIVRGSIDALSTMHRPHGLMWQVVASAFRPMSPSSPSSSLVSSPHTPPLPLPASPLPRVPASSPRLLFRWGALDVLGTCGPQHTCDTCALHPDCQGRAKQRTTAPGHITIDDALRMKSRSSDAAWKSEMLCLQPRRTDCVLPEFDRALHVGDWDDRAWPSSLFAPVPAPLRPTPSGAIILNPPDTHPRWLAGMDFGFRAPTVILLAWVDGEGVLRIEAEHVETERTLAEHIAVLADGAFVRDPSSPAGARPAPGRGIVSSPAFGGFPRPDWVGVDPAGNQRSQQTGISAVTQLSKAGFKVKSRRMEVLQGIELIRARLKGMSMGDAGCRMAGRGRRCLFTSGA